MDQALSLVSQMSVISPGGGLAQLQNVLSAGGIPSLSSNSTTSRSSAAPTVMNPSGQADLNANISGTKSTNAGSHLKRTANGNTKVTFSSENSFVPMPAELDSSAKHQDVAVSSKSLDNDSTTSSKDKSSSSTPPIVGIPTLQTWDLPKLSEFLYDHFFDKHFVNISCNFLQNRIAESYAQRFRDCNQPVPNALRIVIDEVQKRNEKLEKKRIRNRETAALSRARKQQLIDELSTSNAQLRRHALVISYLPDACMAIDVTGRITFGNPQVQRILGYTCEEMEGAKLYDLLVPGSRKKLKYLIRDLLSVAGEYPYGGSSEQSKLFPLREVQVDGKNEEANDVSSEHSSEQDKRSSCVTEDNSEPHVKKRKTANAKNETSISSLETMNVDDVVGSSVTANNADAKLSSLVHQATGGSEDTSSTDDSKPSIRRHTCKVSKAKIPKDSSLDSGYKNSSEDGSEDNDSSNSGSSDFGEMMKGRLRPVAPACSLWLIKKDLKTILCEVTSSIRLKQFNDEDSSLGIIDHNPETTDVEEDMKPEKEILLCFRPLCKGKEVREELFSW